MNEPNGDHRKIEQEASIQIDNQNENSANDSVPPSDDGSGKKESWLDILKFVIITAAIVLPIRFFIAQPFLVSGPSMEPTFDNNDYLIVDEISYRFEKPKRGEVVIFKQAQEDKYLIKRVMGLPGETVQISGDDVIIKNENNPEGFALSQSFVKYKNIDNKDMTVTLTADQYFVMGDNRPVSYDSRYFGPINAKEIVGRPLVRLYPFNHIETFPGYENL